MDVADAIMPEKDGRKWHDYSDLAYGRGGTTSDKIVSAKAGKKDFHGRTRTLDQAYASVFGGVNLSGQTMRETITDDLRRTIEGAPELAKFLLRDEGKSVSQKKADKDIQYKLAAKEMRIMLPGVERLLLSHRELKGIDKGIDYRLAMVQRYVDKLGGNPTEQKQAKSWGHIKRHLRAAIGIEKKSQLRDAKQEK